MSSGFLSQGWRNLVAGAFDLYVTRFLLRRVLGQDHRQDPVRHVGLYLFWIYRVRDTQRALKLTKRTLNEMIVLFILLFLKLLLAPYREDVVVESYIDVLFRNAR